jgi:2-keto-4-pentenoate hydratase/2-oxohepta-3-ene-1,7-dioic acid hydratase in catechol pathway
MKIVAYEGDSGRPAIGLEFLTRSVTLQPGDVVSSGTPGGTGVGRRPQEFLRPGDTVTVGVAGIGYLSNPVGAGW